MTTTRASSSTRNDSTSSTASNPLKLPKFWKSNAELWFALADAQFAQHGINTESAKLFAVIIEMDENVLTIVSDIVLNLPPTAYQDLKKRLIGHYAVSKENRIKDLMTFTELGDKKPSQLLREMRICAKSDVSDNFLKTIWIQRLPTQMQAVLMVSLDSLDELAKIADRISDSIQISSTSISSAQSCSQIECLQNQIADLTQAVDELKFRRYSEKNSLHKKRNGTSSTGFCYFHKRFGANARKCRSPCNFKHGAGNILPDH